MEDIELLAEHISKSLKYLNKNMKNCLEKYFYENYGILTHDNFIDFLRTIGYENADYENQTIKLFWNFYSKTYLVNNESTQKNS